MTDNKRVNQKKVHYFQFSVVKWRYENSVRVELIEDFKKTIQRQSYNSAKNAILKLYPPSEGYEVELNNSWYKVAIRFSVDTHFTGLYKGYEIIKRIDSHTCIIYKDNDIVKCIAGDIYQDGTTNAINKAKEYINQLIKSK